MIVERVQTLKYDRIKIEYFNNISDKELSNVVNNKIFVDLQYAYSDYDDMALQGNRNYDIKKLALIVYLIKNDLYDKSFMYKIWNKGLYNKPVIDIEGNILYHIKAHHFLKKDFKFILISID